LPQLLIISWNWELGTRELDAGSWMLGSCGHYKALIDKRSVELNKINEAV